MKLKMSRNMDEVCYPYIYEHSLMCDYEIHTDEMCRQIGGLIAALQGEFPDLAEEVASLQPKVYHLNGSIRGKCAVSEEDVVWLRELYGRHREATADCLNGFVLPRGDAPVAALNAASSAAKKAIRLMVRLHEQEERMIPDVLHRFCNVLCNYFFVLTLVVNKRRGVEEIPFESASYRTPVAGKD